MRPCSATEASPSVKEFALAMPRPLVPRIVVFHIHQLRPPIAEQHDGFSIRADGAGGERNGQREDDDGFPFASTGLTAFCASSV